VSKREFTLLVDPSLGRKLLFVFPLTNAQLDLTKRKMLSNGSANVKHNEIDFSYVKGVGFFLFELFKKKPRKHLLPSYEMNAGSWQAWVLIT